MRDLFADLLTFLSPRMTDLLALGNWRLNGACDGRGVAPLAEALWEGNGMGSCGVVRRPSTVKDEDDRFFEEPTPSTSKKAQALSPYMNRKPGAGESYEPTHFEHLANVGTHGVGIIPSILAFYYIIDASHRDLQYMLMVIYGIFTTMLFSASTLYHYYEMIYRPLKQKQRLRYYLHICDRAVIYLFIAASYTPWLTLRHCGYPGLNLKWMIWVFAILGILYQYNFHEKYKTLETILYVLVATIPSVAMFTMNDRSGLELMMAGGVVYIMGVIFFKLDGVVPFAHAIWHVHVLLGSAVHTYAVYVSLIGPDHLNPVPDV